MNLAQVWTLYFLVSLKLQWFPNLFSAKRACFFFSFWYPVFWILAMAVGCGLLGSSLTFLLILPGALSLTLLWIWNSKTNTQLFGVQLKEKRYFFLLPLVAFTLTSCSLLLFLVTSQPLLLLVPRPRHVLVGYCLCIVIFSTHLLFFWPFFVALQRTLDAFDKCKPLTCNSPLASFHRNSNRNRNRNQNGYGNRNCDKKHLWRRYKSEQVVKKILLLPSELIGFILLYLDLPKIESICNVQFNLNATLTCLAIVRANSALYSAHTTCKNKTSIFPLLVSFAEVRDFLEWTKKEKVKMEDKMQTQLKRIQRLAGCTERKRNQQEEPLIQNLRFRINVTGVLSSDAMENLPCTTVDEVNIEFVVQEDP